MVPCLRIIWITTFSYRKRVWTTNLLHSGTLAYYTLWPSGLGNYFVCKQFAVQTLLWLLEFVIQIILQHDTITEVTCVGCFEIGISVAVKHVQSIGIIRAFCLPWGTCYDFKCLGGQKKLLGCGLLGGDQYPDWHYVLLYTQYIGCTHD